MQSDHAAAGCGGGGPECHRSNTRVNDYSIVQGTQGVVRVQFRLLTPNGPQSAHSRIGPQARQKGADQAALVGYRLDKGTMEPHVWVNLRLTLRLGVTENPAINQSITSKLVSEHSARRVQVVAEFAKLMKTRLAHRGKEDGSYEGRGLESVRSQGRSRPKGT